MSNSILLRPTTPDEVKRIVEMESTEDAVDFLIPRTEAEHLAQMAQQGISYLSICIESDGGARMVGYMALVEDADEISVECRRIVVSESGGGIGTAAMKEMESYCREVLGRQRVWLDFFENNHRGRHVYEKLGYRAFSSQRCENAVLILSEKYL